MVKRMGTIAVPTSVANGATVEVYDMTGVRVQIVGTFTATYFVDYSCDGTNWVPCSGTGLTATGDMAVPDGARFIRVRCSAYTSGTPAGTYGGCID